MKFTHILLIGALFGAISVDAIKITTFDDDDEDENPDKDAKQPKKINMDTLDADLAAAREAEAKEQAMQAHAAK